jgi:hypothetical protein
MFDEQVSAYFGHEVSFPKLLARRLVEAHFRQPLNEYGDFVQYLRLLDRSISTVIPMISLYTSFKSRVVAEKALCPRLNSHGH